MDLVYKFNWWRGCTVCVSLLCAFTRVAHKKRKQGPVPLIFLSCLPFNALYTLIWPVLGLSVVWSKDSDDNIEPNDSDDNEDDDDDGAVFVEDS